jgi:hypothetical protein
MKIRCQSEFEFKCPQQWELMNPDVRLQTPNELASTASRHCTQCNQNVYFVTRPEELVFAINNKVCIALNIKEPRHRKKLLTAAVGMPLRKTKFKKDDSLDKLTEQLDSISNVLNESLNHEKMTLEEIKKQYEITQLRIRQIENGEL